MTQQANIQNVAEAAWATFRRADDLPARVNPSIPVLFFGDLDEYLLSTVRVVTVGLNPSLREFPPDSPFRRFRYEDSAALDDPHHYLEALSGYFRTHPYKSWFSTFEHLLGGIGASYYPGAPSTALHTDLCSPVATDPTWSQLDLNSQTVLQEDGGLLWDELLKVLHPQIVVLSVARKHIGRIQFNSITASTDLIVFDRKKNGAPRNRPICVSSQWHEINGQPSLFIFVPAAQTPLGTLSRDQKRTAGQAALEAFHKRVPTP